MAKVSLRGAKVGNSTGRYIGPGDHRLRIDGVKIVDSFKNGPMFVVESTILESDTHQPGPGWSWVRPFEDTYGYGKNDIKEFLFLWAGSVTPGFDADAVTDDEVDQLLEILTSADQPAAGMIWEASAYNKETKSGKEITIVRWLPTPETDTATAASA